MSDQRYSDDQPRDDHGRWTDGGGGDSSDGSAAGGVSGDHEHMDDGTVDRVMAKNSGNPDAWAEVPDSQVPHYADSWFDPSTGTWRYSDDQPRDDHGRWVDSGGSGDSSGSGGGGGDVASAAVAAAKQGGGTLDPSTGEEVTSGIAVAVPDHSGIYPADQFFADDAQAAQTVRDWMDQNAEVLSQPNMNVGVWHDTANSEVVLDPSEVVGDRATAIQLGIARDQQAVYDIGAGEEIPTGGTGGRSQAQTQGRNQAEQALLRDVGGGEERAGPSHRGEGQGRLPRRPLPAHRFLERRAGQQDARTWVFDFDETITAAPGHASYLATLIRAGGDRVVVLTGNQSPRADLVQRLDGYGFPFDALIQYEDHGTSGLDRAHYLKQLDAYVGVDNRIDRSPVYAHVCPHLFLVAEPPKEAKAAAKGGKKLAKQAVKAVREARGEPRIPPNYRPADKPGECCGTCDMNNRGVCWGYGNVRIQADHVCDSYDPEAATTGDATDGH